MTIEKIILLLFYAGESPRFNSNLKPQQNPGSSVLRSPPAGGAGVNEENQ
jgi:hypothetical protein